MKDLKTNLEKAVDTRAWLRKNAYSIHNIALVSAEGGDEVALELLEEMGCPYPGPGACGKCQLPFNSVFDSVCRICGEKRTREGERFWTMCSEATKEEEKQKSSGNY